MKEIQFGAVYQRLHNEVEVSQFGPRVEELGFDAIWVTDDIITPRRFPSLDCFSTLAVLAVTTTRIKIGPCVAVLPLRNPAILAKAAATLDFLSGGRLILGVGLGIAVPKLFDTCGIPYKQRAGRSVEVLEAMKRLLTGGKVSYSGQFYQFQDAVVTPKPVQQPCFPIWMGGSSDRTLRMTARFCDGFIPDDLSPEGYKEAARKLALYAREYGRDARDIDKAMHLFTYLDDRAEEALRIGQEVIWERQYYPPGYPVVGGALGTPDQVAEVIQRYIEAGVTHFAFNAACPFSQAMAQIELVAREIIPRFKPRA